MVSFPLRMVTTVEQFSRIQATRLLLHKCNLLLKSMTTCLSLFDNNCFLNAKFNLELSKNSEYSASDNRLNFFKW